MLSVKIGTSFKESFLDNTKTEKILNLAYKSYLSRKEFYRDGCFNILNNQSITIKGALKDIKFSKSNNFNKVTGQQNAMCGHILWHDKCGGCYMPKCYNKCVCFDALEDPFRP